VFYLHPFYFKFLLQHQLSKADAAGGTGTAVYECWVVERRRDTMVAPNSTWLGGRIPRHTWKHGVVSIAFGSLFFAQIPSQTEPSGRPVALRPFRP